MRQTFRVSRHKQRGWAWLAPIAAAAISGIMNKRNTDKANEMAMDMSNTSIQRRVADAQAAGVHPLYALQGGASTFSPAVNMMDLGGMGQDISRALMANKDQEGRDRLGEFMAQKAAQSDVRVMQKESHDLEMQRGNLELEAARLRLLKLQQEVSSPPNPFSSMYGPAFAGTDVSAVKPSGQIYHTGTGHLALPSSDVSEALEGMGVIGHMMAPKIMLDLERSRAMSERAAEAQGAAYEAARNDPLVRDGSHYVVRTRGGWEVRPKEGHGYMDRTIIKSGGNSLPEDYQFKRSEMLPRRRYGRGIGGWSKY